MVGKTTMVRGGLGGGWILAPSPLYCVLCDGKETKVDGPEVAHVALAQHEGGAQEKHDPLCRLPTSICHRTDPRLHNIVVSQEKGATLFQVLVEDRPMSDFASCFTLYHFLHIHELPRTH